jgi:hypothetical protein
MSTESRSRITAQIADVEFVLTECVRINKLLTDTPPVEWKNLPRDELAGSLPHPSGNGDMLCSGQAIRRVWALAEQALKQSDAVGTLETERVHTVLKPILVARFIKEQRAIDEQQVGRALAAAVRQAKRDRSDRVHFIPCRLMYAGDPDTLTVGAVTFVTRAKFNETMASHYEAYVASAKSPTHVEHLEGVLNDARHYYDDFTWVARVNIFNCDRNTSAMRANIAVTAALNFVHVFFGAYHTRRMNVAGPRLDQDRRARLTLDALNRLEVTNSSSATSAVGFTDGWGTFLEGETMALLFEGAAKALEPLVNPAVQRPMGMRLVDAAAWFGDAVREPSAAAQIVKAVTGLETLVMTGEHDDITALLSARAAAVAYHSIGDKTFAELETELRRAYDMRSRLTHGSLSPFDPEVGAYAAVCLHLVEQVICAGLELFESHGLIDTSRTTRELAQGFDQLVAWAKAHSAARASSDTSAP